MNWTSVPYETQDDFSENQITKLFILKVKCEISWQQFVSMFLNSAQN